MAMSKCGSCNSTNFEIREMAPRGATYKQVFVQCAACGVPVGVIGYYEPSVKIMEVDNKVTRVESKMDDLMNELRRIQQRLDQR